MSGIASVGGVTSAKIETEYQVAALKKQQDVTQQLASAAIKLIESAQVAPDSGNGLNIVV